VLDSGSLECFEDVEVCIKAVLSGLALLTLPLLKGSSSRIQYAGISWFGYYGNSQFTIRLQLHVV
jgi:hypothetical protein